MDGRIGAAAPANANFRRSRRSTLSPTDNCCAGAVRLAACTGGLPATLARRGCVAESQMPPAQPLWRLDAIEEPRLGQHLFLLIWRVRHWNATVAAAPRAGTGT